VGFFGAFMLTNVLAASSVLRLCHLESGGAFWVALDVILGVAAAFGCLCTMTLLADQATDRRR
jgi:hypothetical protein